jgi:hypothetical protein
MIEMVELKATQGEIRPDTPTGIRLVDEIAVNGVPRAFCESVVLSDSGFEMTFAKKRKFSAARGMSIIRAAPTVLP